MPDYKKFLKNLKNVNLFATALIAILVSISFFGLMFLFKQQEDDAYIINIAGSQRMLSQKIAFYAYLHQHNLQENTVDKYVQSQLLESAYKLAANQRLLTDVALNEPLQIPNSVMSAYLDKPGYLNKRIENYVSNSITLSKTDNLTIADNIIVMQFDHHLIEALLIDLDKVVTLIEQHVNKRLEYIEIIHAILWLATLLLLIAISIFIFKPLQEVIRKGYYDLYAAKQRSTELNFAINKHAIVYRIGMDKKGTISEVNQGFQDFYCYSEKEIIGRSVFDICGDGYDEAYYEGVFKKCLQQEYWHGESVNKIKGGRELWLSTTIVPLISNEERISSFIVIQNDISGIKQTELALNQLHRITSDLEKSLDEKIEDILILGKQIFSLPIALISEITNQTYRVAYSHTPNNDISPGATFELGNTYCLHTLLADRPTAFHEAGKSKIKNHPCYTSFGLESYIGVPLVVSGKLYGTLNFSSPEASPKPFSERELELIQLFAHWVGSELTRSNNENKLLAQQKLMKEMGEQARIGVWEIDMVKNTIYWSSMTKQIHEVDSDYQPELANAIEFYKEGRSRNKIQALVAKSMEDGTPFESELELVTAKGNTVWVSARGQAELEKGQCIRLYGSFQDVTERVKSQRKIAEHSKRMALATDSAGIGIWEYDINTNELTWDDWMFKLYGISPGYFSGAYDTWERGLHPDDKERAEQELHAAIEQHVNFDTQFRIVWPDGQIKHLKAGAVVNYDEHNNPTTMIGVNYDVTESIENEIALRKAKEEAEVAVTAKNEFFASMSHEIRTPMNGVIGMLDLVKESPLNKEQKHRVGIAQQSAKSLLSLINDVLDFSKLDANKLELENLSFNLPKLVGDLSESFAHQAQHKHLELILDFVNIDECMVVGDSNRIRQILTNLIGNAIKFTKQGEVVIRLSQQSYSSSQWQIIIEVSDTGIGIPQAKQSLLFESFRQLDASTTREYGGTGLGLAIVRKLCLCMQGSIKVKSEEGKGSTFTCNLLLDKSELSVPSKPALDLAGKRILIIDNQQLSAEVVKQQLLLWQLDVDIISNAENALAMLVSHKNGAQYDLLLMNRYMPELEETTFVNKLRSLKQLNDLKIIFMTLMANQNDLEDFKELGVNGYFPKPVTLDNLYDSLNVMLNIPPPEIENTELIEANLLDENVSWTKDVKLLLVEDNRVNQMVALGVLNKIGIDECVIAVNGKDAIAKLKSSEANKPFNFIFMDCQMPEMDGYEASKLIREGAAGARYQDVAIVAMTANAMQGDEQKCLDAGMNDYLVKPINKDNVCNTLKIFLANDS